VRVEEERQPRREVVHRQPGGARRLHVGDSVGEREGCFLHRCRARFADVVAGNRNRVPVRQLVPAPRENVGDDAHRRTHRIDVRPPGDVFLQDVVLHRAGKLLRPRPLLFGHSNVERQEDGGGGVDRHGSRNPLERDACEKRLHVLERIDGHADFAHFAAGEWMVGIEPDLGGQIECHREPALPLAQEVAVALVRFRRCAEPGVLPHRPQPPAVHRWIDAAGEGKLAGEAQLALA
jgi:hypothetical protein